MYRGLILFVLVASIAFVLVDTEWAAVPAPPVNQTIGMDDILLGDLTEAECRACHGGALPDRHHLLYGKPIPPGSLVPYPDSDHNGTPDTTYGCLNCHNQSFTAVRDCTVCHTPRPHHVTPAAKRGDCVSCHGDVVDNFDDGHYVPTYSPSMTTPSSRRGDGLPLNSRGKGAGACDYCHEDDGLGTPIIRDMSDLHHAALSQPADPVCLSCHGMYDVLDIRVCERCHGPDSLHAIQADSPAVGNRGTIVVGAEDAGYGHAGTDNGPGDSDCWGCHGFAMTSFASTPSSGPIIPTVYYSDRAVIRAGTATMVVLSGTGFTNTYGKALYDADVRLTAANGSSVTLTPDIIIDQGNLVVTIPSNTRPGNYNLQATKAGFTSNPAVISVVPEVRISRATYRGSVTILGSGFGGYAAGSATSLTGTVTTGTGRRATTKTVAAKIVSWSDTKIEADFGVLPAQVTVKSVFGSAKSSVSRR